MYSRLSVGLPLLFLILVSAPVFSGNGVEVTAATVRERLPARLKTIIADKAAARTSQIEWSLKWIGGRDDGLIERHITRTTPDALWQSNLGDERGGHQSAVDAETGEIIPGGELTGTRNSLLYDGYAWHMPDGGRRLTGSISPFHERQRDLPFDFSAAGWQPRWSEIGQNVLGLHVSQLEGFESATFTSHEQGPIELIVAEYEDKRIEWSVDQTRGDCPTRAAFYRGGALEASSTTEWALSEGRWIPVRMQFFRGPEEKPVQEITVDRATFDQPWHAQSITPEDIGVMYGTQLRSWNDWPMSWDGTRVLSSQELTELMYVYGVQPDPAFLEEWAEASEMSVEEFTHWQNEVTEKVREEYFREHGESPWLLTRWKERDEWDVFVEKFVEEHQLDEPRAKKAGDILERCKRLRDYYKRKNIREIREAERAGNAAKLARYEAITQRIFETVLVPGLKRLAGDRKRMP